MNTKMLLAATAAAALFAANANAADSTYYDPAPQPSYEPTPQASAMNWNGLYAGVQLGGGRLHVEGVGNDTALVGGAHAGYLWQNGSFVAGPEVDIDATGWNVAGTDVDAVAHAKIRAGVAVDRMLVTGSIGYGHMWADGDSDGGLTAGAGVDFAITDNVIGGADYLYTDAGSNPDVNAHTIRTRLGYKFN